MKNLIALGLLFGSLSATAQSYLVLNNGVMLTTDKAGYVYDFGHFVVPYEVKINGGQFLVEKKQLITVDEKGFKYDKDEEVKKAKGTGLNYLVNDDSELITIDQKGFFYKFDKDSAIKRIVNFGGNYFTAKDEKKKNTLLYTVNSQGNYFNMAVPEINPADIAVFGGTYFIMKNGLAVTVSKDGFVYPKKDVKVGAVKKLGGNYLIDVNNKLYTVSESGILSNPVVPMALNLANVTQLGANYMLDNNGKIFVVDQNGNVFERVVNNHDLRNVKVISY